MKKRILVLEFRQESNTFNPVVTQIADFNAGAALEGEDVIRTRLDIPSAVKGAVDAFAQWDAEPVYTVFMRAQSGGRVADDALQHVMERVTDYAKNNHFDAIYASLHGATCCQTEDDACGALLAHLRSLAGDKPVVASFDMHANITTKVLQNADAVCGYQTYPHRDLYEAGNRAGKLCMDMLRGEKFYMASAAVPMLIPPAGYTTDDGAYSQLLNWGKELVAQGKLLDFTVFAVQPWLDIPEIASRIIAIASDPETAKAYADQLAQRLFDLRDETMPDMLTVDQIIDIAESNTTGKPVILSEPADSPNGGCVGDSPIVAMRLLERGSKLRAGMFVVDPEAVQQAFALGVGGTGVFSVGAGFTPGMPGPLVAEGRVLSLHDGSFVMEGPATRGDRAEVGLSAVVRFGTVDILLCNRCTHSGDPQLYRHFGIEPTLYDLIVVKANTSFRLPYGMFTDLIYIADTVGAGASNLRQLQWQNLPDGLYPFGETAPISPARIW